MKKNHSKKGRSVRDSAKSSAEPLYPYSGQDVSGFFSRHESVRVAYLKIERSIEDFGHHICEIVLNAEGERLFVQGIEFQQNRFRYPPISRPYRAT